MGVQKRRNWIDWLLAAALALVSSALVCLQIDTGGDYPGALKGPGLTLDEPFNVSQGIRLDEALQHYGIGLLAPESIREVFHDEPTPLNFGGSPHLADHPPLGRLWLGAVHRVVLDAFPPAEERPMVISAARVAPASAFGLTVFVVVLFAIPRYGRLAGMLAGASLVMMPRVFAHAHLASLETFMNLTTTLATLALAGWWTARRKVTAGTVFVSGLLLGLALLTKIQAVFIPVIAGLWAVSHLRMRLLVPMFFWGVIGVAVFFVFWPWLWLDPVEHLREYFARTTERTTLYTFYAGERVKDVDVTWHYPFVLFATTVPVGLLGLGLVGSLASLARGRSAERLILIAMLFPLAVFALPGTAVYDGERLFLVSFPMLAILIGRGIQVTLGLASRWVPQRAAAFGLALIVAGQSYGSITTAPQQLSYYNLLVGGVSGAETAGFESTYWGDCLTRSFWESVPENSTVAVAPVLHPLRLPALMEQTPVVRERNIRLERFFYDHEKQPGYLLFVHRKADLPQRYWSGPEGAEEVATVKQDGVVLARLILVRGDGQ